jgi:hypothetical protein
MANHYLLGITVFREADESDSPTKKVPGGIYSNNTKLYEAIITAHTGVVRRRTPEKIRKYEFKDLLIKMPSGVRTVTYSRLNTQLRRETRIALVNDALDVATLTVWVMTMNTNPKEH